LAVAVMFPLTLNPAGWGLLGQNKVLVGDITHARRVDNYHGWRGSPAPQGADAFLLRPPEQILSGLSRTTRPQFSGLRRPASIPLAKPAVLLSLPPINDLLYGARPGGIGETCAVVILVCGVYLVYRNYVKWQLPLGFIAAAWCILAIAPIRFAAPNQTIRVVWFPISAEGFDAGFTYVNYQLFSGELLLGAFFLATEMTSRPVTAGGQLLFGVGCGVVAMLLKLYVNVPIPCYMGVLAMNTLTPTIDRIWRPRVFGMRAFQRIFRR